LEEAKTLMVEKREKKKMRCSKELYDGKKKNGAKNGF
jgi:hypothetical protein